MAVYFRLAREAGEDVNVTHLAKDLAGVDESGKANPPIPRANIYKWRHMGNGIMEFGIEPDTDEWSALNEIANSVPMSWALDGYDFDSIRTDANGKPTIKEQFHGFSQENFDKALALYYPEGIRDEEKNVLRKPVSPKDAKDEIAKEYASEADKEQIEKDKREAIALRVKEAVKFLAANLKDVDADVWTAIEENYRKANAAARQHSQRAAEAAHAAEVARVAAEGEAKAS